MTCDDAFDLLTRRGPQGPDLCDHLRDCPRCRQMRETLSPALQELAPPDDERTARSPWIHAPEASHDSVAIARTAAHGLSASGSTYRRRGWVVHALRCAAILLSGAALGILAVTALPPRGSAPAAGIPPAACTRDLARSTSDARALVRTCVACHLAAP